jgi:hypothetical protein
MNRVSETIISMLDKGQDIFDVAKFFGGIHELLSITKKYPYLYAIIQTKLGGSMDCSAEGEDKEMVMFSLNFILTDLEAIDVDDYNHYDATVDIIIPEIKNSPALMQMVLTWLDYYLQDLGAEVGSFNDDKLNNKEIWIYAESINGKSFKDSIGGVRDEEVLRIIPEKYKEQ